MRYRFRIAFAQSVQVPFEVDQNGIFSERVIPCVLKDNRPNAEIQCPADKTDLMSAWHKADMPVAALTYSAHQEGQGALPIAACL
jgi:hypothetical protein